jgi:glycosyltransferase involved in cell wall biosynthesis
MADKEWICCQIGAREHYAVARVLHRSGRLAGLYTDFWAGAVLHRFLPVLGLNSLAGRFHVQLTDARVESWNWRTIGEKLKVERKKQKWDDYIEVGGKFAYRVTEALQRRNDLGTESIVFSYDTGALETFQWCRQHRMRCILGQMDPNRVEVESVREETKRWPGWAAEPAVPEEYLQRREQEWELADRIVVNSEFCRQALLKQGVPAEKLAVIPLCYENAATATTDYRPQTTDHGLRVLFLGQVILRKGIQYLIEAARRLEGENVRFDVVGAIGISPEAVASAPSNVIFHGRVDRGQAGQWYQRADVFVLPTISDGFAITQLEAMAHGLPVIATPCCGEVVSHGIDGFIVPDRDADALARSLQQYLAEPRLLKDQGLAALNKSRQFTLERLAGNLQKLETALDVRDADPKLASV